MRCILSFFIALLAIFSFQSTYADLAIYHLNVNNGDSTLIIDTESNKTLLVDAGDNKYGNRVVAPFLIKMGITNVDYFLATHYHEDHIGGFPALIDQKISFNEILDRGDFHEPGKTTESGKQTIYAKYVEKAGSKRKTIILNGCVSQQSNFNLGPDTIIEVIACAGKYLNKDCTVGEKTLKADSKHENDHSIAMIIRHGNFDYFLGGDLTGNPKEHVDMESLIAAKVGDVDVMKVNHHGSITSSNILFLKSLSPEVAIISVGNGERNKAVWRLPKQIILNRLEKEHNNTQIYLTNKGEQGRTKKSVVVNGNIAIFTNGKGYTINGAPWPTDK